jgi:Lrp/AsnC family leucine-responsive transcriptional regulator
MIGLDSTDFKILKILQENGRITNIQLSMDIGLSPAPTLERVRKLEAQGYINSYHAMVNEELLGLKIKTFIQVSINYQKTDAIKNFSKQIMKIDEVVECHHISGSADFLLKVIVPDIKSYERLILDKISKILEISHLQTMMILSTTKYSHALPLEY